MYALFRLIVGYFSLHPSPPFRLDLTVWGLRRQAHNAMDVWEQDAYLRTWNYGETRLALRLWQTRGVEEPMLEGEIYAGPDDDRAIAWVCERLQWILGLDRDLTPWYVFAAEDPRLASLRERYRGFRPPRFDSLYEGLINAVACQQVSLQVGILLLNRLRRAYEGDSGGLHQTLPFPTPQQLLEQEPELLRSLGFSRQKVRGLRAVAEAARAGDLDERAWQGMPAEAIRDRLTQIPGIGRWSAEYVLLRALGRLDIFPGDDVGGRKGLLRWLGGEARAVGYEDTLAHLKAWAPFAGMVYFFMLLRRLEEAGYIA